MDRHSGSKLPLELVLKSILVDLQSVIRRHGLCRHYYSDDVKIGDLKSQFDQAISGRASAAPALDLHR
jgi:hypothetical protein